MREASRREFLGMSGSGLLAARPAEAATPSPPAAAPTVKPPRLNQGDTVGLIDPASATFLRQDVQIVTETLMAMGFTVKRGAHLMDRYGYLAGRDQDRAADINALFADGAMIGHIDQQFTLPIGLEAEIDAIKGTIRLLEPAVA